MGIELVAVIKLLAAEGRAGEIHQWMADVIDVHTGPAQEIFFEGKDANDLAGVSAEQFHPVPAPGPHLGRNEVNDRDAAAVELAGHMQVQAGRVNEHGEARPAVVNLRQQMPEDGIETKVVADDFKDSQDAELTGVSDQLHPGLGHGIASDAEPLHR